MSMFTRIGLLLLTVGCGRLGFRVAGDAGDGPELQVIDAPSDGATGGVIDGPRGARVIALTTGTSFAVPGDWNNASNSIECIGGGGAGGRAGSDGGGGGGAGTYAKAT
ncbi:MAG TPA: hypothetical protein VLM79_19860, partial [Kofleriaceae bacterium]|nr:hypothetical protein [Kofleriaceae bacterium]